MTTLPLRASAASGLLLGLLMLAGCSTAGSPPTPSSPPSSPPTAPSALPSVQATPLTSVAPSITSAPSTESPATSTPATPTVPPTPTGTPAEVIDAPWAVAPLTDVTTGETFRITDIVASGKVVFVEPMAIWCTNCRTQQVAAREAFEILAPGTAEWVGVDVETTETADALARYSEQNAFPFRYVIADNDLSRSLVEQFGEVVLSPPSVNVIIVGTDGQVAHMLGHHSAAELVALATEHAR